MDSLLQDLDRSLRAELDRPRWVVAFSGGLDSTVLLHALCQLRVRPPLHAIHIHHGLQAQADDWLDHCRALCESWGVAFFAAKVEVGSGASVESAARDARYQAFEAFLHDGDLLLQAHHLDDQVETLLLRLFRGSGPAGLQGIPRRRALAGATLLRPLLALPRSELEAYAQAWDLRWIEDPSNADAAFDRNYLRHQLLPLVAARWPGYRKTLARFADLMAQTAAAPALAGNVGGGKIDQSSPDSIRDVSALRAMGEAERNVALRQWLGDFAITPSQAQLEALQRSMLWSSHDAEPVFELVGRQVRRFQGRLYLTALRPFDAEACYEWDGRAPLQLPGSGRLSAEREAGAPNHQFEIRFRRGGERCRPAGRRHSRSLKKLLQESRIPPWQRPRLPLIYLNGELAAVAGLWLCHELAEALNGWRFYWHPEG